MTALVLMDTVATDVGDDEWALMGTNNRHYYTLHDFQETVKFTGCKWHLAHSEVKTLLVDSLPPTVRLSLFFFFFLNNA